ncbi:MAG: hypothetical protein AAF710_05635 [Planctomycetota bacterium]
MLKLVCPSCSFKLEIDAGFAGGVCRCTSCGAVLSVPRDPQRDAPTMIRKPSSSSSGSGRPANPSGSSSAASASSAGTSAGSRAGSRAGGSRAGTAAAVIPQFTTEGGGAEPALGHLAAPPPRPKARPALVGLAVAGWATFAVEWVVVIVIVLGRGTSAPVVEAAPATAYNNNVPAARAATPTPTPRTETATTTTPARPETARPAASIPPPAATPTDPNNIFTMRRPNVLGLPLENGHTAVLFDAIERSAPWFDDGKAALKAGLARSGNSQARVSLVATRNKQIRTLGDSPLTPAPARLGDLTRFLDPLTPAGSGGLGDALDAAVATGADRVVFVTSRSDHWGGYLNTLKGKLSPDGRTVRLDVVQIGDVSNELRGFVEQQPGGRYRLLTPQRLADWRKAADG